MLKSTFLAMPELKVENARIPRYSQWRVRRVVHGVQAAVFVVVLLLGARNLSGSDPDDRVFDLPESPRPVKVQTSFHLLNLQNIDDEAETFEFSGVLTLRWKDERQAFDPDSTGVKEKLYHGSFQVNELSPAYFPQVILANASQIPESQGILLRVAADGSCTLIQDLHAIARTELHLRRYPFDNQRLEAVFQVLGFDRSQVMLTGETNPVSADVGRICVPQWQLESVTGEFRQIQAPYHSGIGDAATFVLALDVRRESFFITRLVIIPLLVIVFLSWCVFWMDRASLPDRMAVTFVGLLTAVAFQAMLGEIMPHISYVTFINAFISLSFLVMSATAAVNLLVCHFDRCDNRELAQRIDQRSRWIFPVSYAVIILIALYATFYLL